MKKSYTYILILFIAFSSCQVFTFKFSTQDLEYINWFTENSEFTFVSSKKDTVIYKITSINDERDGRNNPIECGGTFFTAIYTKKIWYEKISKDTTYIGEFMKIEKYSDGPADIELNFEGLYNEFYSIKFNKKYTFNNTRLTDIASFEANQLNSSFPEKKRVSKIWWSKSKGLLKYQTNDSLVWKRIK
jgi:hypothetical protein